MSRETVEARPRELPKVRDIRAVSPRSHATRDALPTSLADAACPPYQDPPPKRKSSFYLRLRGNAYRGAWERGTAGNRWSSARSLIVSPNEANRVAERAASDQF